MVEKTTTIRVSKDTIERLKKIGKFGESYNDIIGRVFNEMKDFKKTHNIKYAPRQE